MNFRYCLGGGVPKLYQEPCSDHGCAAATCLTVDQVPDFFSNASVIRVKTESKASIPSGVPKFSRG